MAIEVRAKTIIAETAIAVPVKVKEGSAVHRAFAAIALFFFRLFNYRLVKAIDAGNREAVQKYIPWSKWEERKALAYASKNEASLEILETLCEKPKFLTLKEKEQKQYLGVVISRAIHANQRDPQALWIAEKVAAKNNSLQTSVLLGMFLLANLEQEVQKRWALVSAWASQINFSDAILQMQDNSLSSLVKTTTEQLDDAEHKKSAKKLLKKIITSLKQGNRLQEATEAALKPTGVAISFKFLSFLFINSDAADSNDSAQREAALNQLTSLTNDQKSGVLEKVITYSLQDPTSESEAKALPFVKKLSENALLSDDDLIKAMNFAITAEDKNLVESLKGQQAYPSLGNDTKASLEDNKKGKVLKGKVVVFCAKQKTLKETDLDDQTLSGSTLSQTLENVLTDPLLLQKVLDHPNFVATPEKAEAILGLAIKRQPNLTLLTSFIQKYRNLSGEQLQGIIDFVKNVAQNTPWEKTLLEALKAQTNLKDVGADYKKILLEQAMKVNDIKFAFALLSEPSFPTTLSVNELEALVKFAIKHKSLELMQVLLELMQVLIENVANPKKTDLFITAFQLAEQLKEKFPQEAMKIVTTVASKASLKKKSLEQWLLFFINKNASLGSMQNLIQQSALKDLPTEAKEKLFKYVLDFLKENYELGFSSLKKVCDNYPDMDLENTLKLFDQKGINFKYLKNQILSKKFLSVSDQDLFVKVFLSFALEQNSKNKWQLFLSHKLMEKEGVIRSILTKIFQSEIANLKIRIFQEFFSDEKIKQTLPFSEWLGFATTVKDIEAINSIFSSDLEKSIADLEKEQLTILLQLVIEHEEDVLKKKLLLLSDHQTALILLRLQNDPSKAKKLAEKQSLFDKARGELSQTLLKRKTDMRKAIVQNKNFYNIDNVDWLLRFQIFVQKDGETPLFGTPINPTAEKVAQHPQIIGAANGFKELQTCIRSLSQCVPGEESGWAENAKALAIKLSPEVLRAFFYDYLNKKSIVATSACFEALINSGFFEVIFHISSLSLAKVFIELFDVATKEAVSYKGQKQMVPELLQEKKQSLLEIVQKIVYYFLPRFSKMLDEEIEEFLKIFLLRKIYQNMESTYSEVFKKIITSLQSKFDTITYTGKLLVVAASLFTFEEFKELVADTKPILKVVREKTVSNQVNHTFFGKEELKNLMQLQGQKEGSLEKTDKDKNLKLLLTRGWIVFTRVTVSTKRGSQTPGVRGGATPTKPKGENRIPILGSQMPGVVGAATPPRKSVRTKRNTTLKSE